ncbi:hypothetical protein PRIPAC_85063 [Pristionchus pacificus]|uniref:Uncharacterized protein n=1 Tax=Pristionchus pacificus TaxID=54126 RepID=A0A2A6CIG6_PRIPA|nr:hypothetical protein PRIPAC_85063 [Pristionchus pacificus]|eukprot:PDM78024.1 hypothetical protein PRIPAC_35213 [Pristionchus pacificus]
MFYSTDLLLRKDARFSLIWRLAITNGHAGGTKKRQILAVNIESIVAELQQRIPSQPLTADQQKNCFSLRLISQLLFGTCIVLQYQISNLYVDAKHVWDSCKHIRFDEKDKLAKRKKKDDKRGDDLDWDQVPPDEPLSKKRKRRSDGDKVEFHESQVVMGMDFLDRALVSRSAFDITNITLPDDTMFIGAGMNDPMFIQPDQDLIPTTDAMMDAFLNGEDVTMTTKESSENHSGEQLMNMPHFGGDRASKRSKDERAASETIERHRASSHVSQLSMGRNGTMQQPLNDDMMLIDDPNLSSSMAGIEGDTRTSVPAHFVSAGPLAVSSQVDPALEPILPSEASQILPIETMDQSTLAAPPPDELFINDIPDAMMFPPEKDDDGEKRASAGSEDMRRDIMGDIMMADEMEDRARERRDVMRGSPRIEETPKVKRRKERNESENEEDDEQRLIVPKKERELQPIKLDGAFMKESMNDYSDTLVGKNGRRVKIYDKRKKKPSDLMKSLPTLMGRHLAKNDILNNLFKSLEVDKIKLIDDLDLLDVEEEQILEPLEEIERQMKIVEEEEEEENAAKRRRIDETVADGMNELMNGTRMDDMTMMMIDTVSIDGVERVEHISVAIIEGDWEERNEYVDRHMENRFEDKELNEEERRRMMEERDERKEEENEEMEEARRRRRTTGNMSDGLRMGDHIDLIDQFPTMMMDETRRSETRMDEGELRIGEEVTDKLEYRLETEARVNREKRNTMAQVEHHQAQKIIIDACKEAEPDRVTLEQLIPVGANKATVARMFYNLLVLTKKKSIVPDQTEAYGTIQIGLCGDTYKFPIYEEV